MARGSVSGPHWGVAHRNFADIFFVVKLESLGYIAELFLKLHI